MLLKNIISKLNNAIKQKKRIVILNNNFNNNSILYQFLNILENEGFIEYWNVDINNIIKIKLIYDSYGNSTFKLITFLSKSGQPLFWKTKNLWQKINKNNLVILHTSKGLLTENEARSLNIGGALFCVIN